MSRRYKPDPGGEPLATLYRFDRPEIEAQTSHTDSVRFLIELTAGLKQNICTKVEEA